jgi:hypothetical protein
MRGRGQQVKTTPRSLSRFALPAYFAALQQPRSGLRGRVNPSACSIHFWHVYSVNTAFCVSESLKRDKKRDKKAQKRPELGSIATVSDWNR